MSELIEIREYLKGIYSRFDIYIESVLKFVLSVVVLMLIGMNIGYEGRLQNPGLIVIIGLLCSFLPVAVLALIAAAFCVLHVYVLSLECAIVVLVLFLIMFLVFFRFSPGDSLVLLLTPICFALRIPYAIPLCCGLALTPLSAVSACCGVVTYYVLDYIHLNESAIRSLEEETTVARFRFIVDGILANKTMMAMAAVFAVTILLVYIIRRLPVDHAWTIAMFAGFFAGTVMLFAADMKMGFGLSISGVIIGQIISLAIAAVLKFFLFSVDYNRAESLQFEDDEYYYYVKAIPKLSLSAPDKKVKRINTRRDEEVSSEKKSARDYPVFNNARLDDADGGTGHRSGSYTRTQDTAPLPARSAVTGRTGTRPGGVRPGAVRQTGTRSPRPVSSEGLADTAPMRRTARSSSAAARADALTGVRRDPSTPRTAPSPGVRTGAPAASRSAASGGVRTGAPQGIRSQAPSAIRTDHAARSASSSGLRSDQPLSRPTSSTDPRTDTDRVIRRR